MNQRNSYIIRRMFSSFFVATLLIALTKKLGTMVDCIVVSNFVSLDALSAFRLWDPFLILLILIISLMESGAVFLTARSIGNQDYEKVNKIFNCHFYYTIIITTLIVACLLPFTDIISETITDNPRLLPHLKSYIYIEYLGLFVQGLCVLPTAYIINNGNPKYVTRCFLISQICNLIFDLLLCGVFNMGVIGGSLASMISRIVGLLSLIRYIRSNSSIFKIRKFSKYFSLSTCRECIIIGTPMLIAGIAAPILTIIMNQIVLARLGADGFYTLTVYFEISGICLVALAGSANAINSIGGILIGEEDYESFSLLIRQIFRTLIPIMLTASIFVALFPETIVRLFGATDELVKSSAEPLRIVSLYLIPNTITATLRSLYFVQGYHKLSRWIELVAEFSQIALIAIVAWYTPKLIWYVMPVLAWLCLLLILVASWIIHRQNVLLKWPTLQSAIPQNPSSSFSIPYTTKGAQDFIKKVQPFIEACELNEGILVSVALEELVYDIVDNNPNRDSNEFFDVRIIDKEEHFMIVLKSKGKPYNPLYKYESKNIEEVEEDNLRKMLLNAACKSINHKYINGINCIYLNYSHHLS